MNQIGVKGYLDKYASSGKQKYTIANNFNSRKKRVEEISLEEVQL